LHEANIQIQAKVVVFDALRVAMRIALPASHRGLKDEGEPDIKTIEARVKAFRHCDKIKALLPTDLGYRKMMKQTDLAQRFADIELVRQELKQDEEAENKYLKGMAKLFRISNLPAKLTEAPQNKMAMTQSNQTLRS
jgi:hypothetical protein